MAQFTLTVNARINLPPSQIGNKTINIGYDETYIFTVNDFTTTTIPIYQDPEGDLISQLKVVTIPITGGLKLDGVDILSSIDIPVASIESGLLTYKSLPIVDGYTDSNFTFDLADIGSNSFSGLTPGIVTINVAAQINLPPSQVGDNSLTTNFGQTIVFTRDNFTTETTPIYIDPEGDPAECLQILSLPSEGVLQLDGIDVILNQEILFTDIDSGLFTFVPNNLNTNTYNVLFESQIKDSGSGQYTP